MRTPLAQQPHRSREVFAGVADPHPDVLVVVLDEGYCLGHVSPSERGLHVDGE